MRKSKRIAAAFLALFAFCLFCCGPLANSARALVGVDDAVIAIIIVTLAALGITFTTTGAYDSLQEYVSDLFSQFSASNGMSPASMLSGTQSGTSKAGKILLNNRFVIVIQTFAEWLKAKFSLSNNSQLQVVSPGADLAGYTLYDLPVEVTGRYSGDNYKCVFGKIAGAEIYVLLEWGNNNHTIVNCIFISNSPFTIQRIVYRNGIVLTSDSFNGAKYNDYWYSSLSGLQDFYTDSLSNYVKYPQNTYRTALSSGDNIDVNNIGIDIDTGVITLPTDDPTYTNGDGAIVDLNSPWGSSYDDVIGDIENGFSDSGSLDADITYAGEEQVQDQVEDTPSQSLSNDAGDYQAIGLQNVFPFCIPFDIYAFFGCLAADPVAPVINWRFYIPGICDETITIDLSVYDSVAQVLRTMELLAFIIGLAFVTREKFLRG